MQTSFIPTLKKHIASYTFRYVTNLDNQEPSQWTEVHADPQTKKNNTVLESTVVI